MFISDRGKDDYINGEAPKSNSIDSKYKTWKAKNNMVMSWLINSITNEVRVNFILHKMAQENATKDKYFNPEDTSNRSKFHPPQNGTRNLGCRKGDVFQH